MNKKKNNRVVVGLSGGVDSSVAAYLLKEQGYEVIGLFMKNWHDETLTLNNECAWIDDSADALQIAHQLDIPFQVVDLSSEYKQRIVAYMFDEYQRGRTPNPDVLCNREIKFDAFLKIALSLGADFVATGHYCQKNSFKDSQDNSIFQLIGGADASKDQSYFLCQVNQYQLSKALFPIGHLQKSEVRAIAQNIGLVTAQKKDSQGLCFVGKISLPDFLQQQLQAKTGKVIEIEPNSSIFDANFETIDFDDNEFIIQNLDALTQPYAFEPDSGRDIGTHIGAHFFTIGQRKGLNIGGKPLPLFVLGTDTVENVIYVGQGEHHKGLNRWGLRIAAADVHFVRSDLEMQVGETRQYWVRIRYRQALERAKLFACLEGLYVVFEAEQKGVAAGQFAAWYSDANELIGSGVIG